MNSPGNGSLDAKVSKRGGCSQANWADQCRISHVCQTLGYLGPEWELCNRAEWRRGPRSPGHGGRSSLGQWSRPGLTSVWPGRRRRCGLLRWSPSPTGYHWWSPWRRLWGRHAGYCSAKSVCIHPVEQPWFSYTISHLALSLQTPGRTLGDRGEGRDKSMILMAIVGGITPEK